MTISQVISDLSTPPTTADPENFDDRADQFNGELPTFQQEVNVFGGQVNDTVDDIDDIVPLVYKATSISSVLIATGDQTFALVESSKGFIEGVAVRIARTANPGTDYMIGIVKSYSGNTLVVTVSSISGSGTHAAWSISVTIEGDAATFEGRTYSQAMATVNLINYQDIGGSL